MSSPSSSSRRTLTCARNAANGSRPILPAAPTGPCARRRREPCRPRNPRPDAPGIVHDIGAAEFDRVAVSGALLQARGDPVVQRRRDRSARWRAGRRAPAADDRKERRELGEPRQGRVRFVLCRAPRARRKTRASGAVRHAAHGGPGASARPELQTDRPIEDRPPWLRAATNGFHAASPSGDQAPSRCGAGLRCSPLETRRAAGHSRGGAAAPGAALKRQ